MKTEKLDKQALDELLTQLKAIYSPDNKNMRAKLSQDLINKITFSNSLSYFTVINAFDLCRDIDMGSGSADIYFDSIYDKFIKYAEIAAALPKDRKSAEVVTGMLEEELRKCIR